MTNFAFRFFQLHLSLLKTLNAGKLQDFLAFGVLSRDSHHDGRSVCPDDEEKG